MFIVTIASISLFLGCDEDLPTGNTGGGPVQIEQDVALIGNWKHIISVDVSKRLSLNSDNQYDTTLNYKTLYRGDNSQMYFSDMRITIDSIYTNSILWMKTTDSLWTTGDGILNYYNPSMRQNYNSYYEINGDTLKLWSMPDPTAQEAHILKYYLTTEETLEELEESL